MKIFTQSLFASLSFLFFSILLPHSVYADTTPFRSASVVTTDGSTHYTNLGNCSATDGDTCDRTSEFSFGNLYFQKFGDFTDFGMPENSNISAVRIKVTGKASKSLYVGLSKGANFQWNCQSPSDLWTLYLLNGPIITTQTFFTPVSETAGNGKVSKYCFTPENFSDESFTLRINYSHNSQSWSANIDNLEIAFDYDPPVNPPESKTPLILIPGFGGSELKVDEEIQWSRDDGHGGIYTHTYPADETIWVNILQATKPGNDDYFDILRMKPNGVDSEANISLTGELFSVYQETLDFFISKGYTLNQDLFIFPYDWRKDIALTELLLDQKIESVKIQTGSNQVDIVAHSMGGLVARNYIADADNAANVRKLFTLGTPHLGTTSALSNIIHGSCLTYRTLLSQYLCLGVSPSEVKDIVQNFTGIYQLAPTQTYFYFYDNSSTNLPYPLSSQASPLNYSQIKTFLTEHGHNTSLFAPAESFHSLDNILVDTNGVEVVNIVGSGLPTLGQIIEKQSLNIFGVVIPQKDELLVNGDGTVPLYSASLIDPNRGLSLSGNTQVFYTNQDHGVLTNPGPALNLVNNVLKDSLQTPVGISTNPFDFSGTVISSHSPINLHVYDVNNNHTGSVEVGQFEANIPGSTINTLGDAKFIYLPEEGVYRIYLEATAAGSFDFKIREFKDSQNSQTILYKNVPLTSNTSVQTTMNTESDLAPILLVDEDGDGNTDFSVDSFNILEGSENYDVTPPQLDIAINPKLVWPPNGKTIDINISGVITDANPYLVTIIVIDEYGLVEPTIAVENQTNINETLQLHAFRRGHDINGRTYTIKVLATDRAGNSSLFTDEVIVSRDQRKGL